MGEFLKQYSEMQLLEFSAMQILLSSTTTETPEGDRLQEDLQQLQETLPIKPDLAQEVLEDQGDQILSYKKRILDDIKRKGK